MPNSLVIVCILASTQYTMQQREVKALTRLLGDRDYAVRQGAQEQLFLIGGPAVRQLEQAAEHSQDPEIRRRSENAVRAIFTDYLGDPRRLPDVSALPLEEFVRMAPRYEPRALALARRDRAVNTKTYIWSDPLVSQFMMTAYLQDKIRRGASRAQVRRRIDMLRDSRTHLHPPLSRLPGYAEAIKELKKIPWYFEREYP